MAKLPSPGQAERPSLLGGGGGIRAATPEATPRLGAEAEGTAAMAHSLDRVSDKLFALQDRERQRDDALQTNRAINQLQESRIDLTAGQQNGFRRVQGINADQSVIDGYMGRFEEAATRIRTSLASEDQRRRFDMEQGSVRLGFQSDLFGHVAREKDRAEDDQLKATLETEKRAAAVSGNDPMALETSVLRVENELANYGERRGLSRQRVDEMKADARSGMYVAALGAQRLTDPVGALATYQAVGEQINIEQRVKIEEALFADAAPVLAAQLNAERNFDASFNTRLSPAQEQAFLKWKAQHAPKDSGADYDLRGAFKAGLKPAGPEAGADEGHWPDTFKKPNHPTFSNESRYAPYGKPGKWEDNKFIPPEKTSRAEIVTGNPVVDKLPPDQRMRVMDLARTQAEQGSAQLRQGLTIRANDAAAALERGQAAPNAPTFGELVSAFGDERGVQMARDLEKARQFGDAYVRVAGASRAGQQSILANLKPNENAPGFAEGVRRYEQLAGVIDRVRKEQDQDPAGFVLTQSPARQRVMKGLDGAPTDVRSTFEHFTLTQNDPKAAPEDKANAARAYAAATVAEQSRLGVQNPQILPKGMVDDIARRFAAPPAQGENPANVMRGMVDQWGPFWPAVGKQLKGKLPPEMEVIGLGVSPEAEAILAETSRLKPEQLRQGLADGDVKDIRERVRSAFEPLQRSVAWQDGGISTYDNFADSAEKIATALVQKGMKPKDAAQKAFESLAGFKYEFEDGWRVPKAELGGGVTPRTMREGAEALKRDITSDKPVLGEKVGLQVPQTPGAVRPQDADRQWRDTIKANGFWVTSPGDGGLTLYVKSGLSAQPVLDDRGQPVRRSWSEIGGIGRAASAATFSDMRRMRP